MTTDLDTLTSAVVAQMVSSYTCLGCGDALPPRRGGHCDACCDWQDDRALARLAADMVSDPLDDYEEDPYDTQGSDFEEPAIDDDEEFGRCKTCGGEGRIAAYGCGDQAGGYADTCQECKGRVDPDPPADPQPWDGPCKNCGGAHHIQCCPEILAALFAPGQRTLLFAMRTTAQQWTDEDLRQDAIARAWSKQLLATQA